jgi:hydroxymethylbilane synthase
MEDRITQRLSLMGFTPSPGQGALALVTRKDNKKLIKILGHVNHPASMAEAQAERAFMKKIGGGCKVPLGVIAQASGRTISLHGSMLSPDGRAMMEVRRSGDVARPKELGARAAADMLKLGAASLISSWRNP